MVAVKHTQVTSTNNPAHPVSANAWNDAHTITGTPGKGLVFDSGGNAAEIDPFAAAATRSALAAIATQASGSGRYLNESGREGTFIWSAANLSAKVAADTAQGIYVAPASDTSGASGAWTRVVPNGVIWADWFGFTKGDNAGANAAGNDAIWAALHATLITRAGNILSAFQGLETVRFGLGWYEFSSPLESTNGTSAIEGLNTPRANLGFVTYLKFYNSHGIRTQRFDTSGDSTVDGVTHRAGNCTIRNIAIGGNYTGTEAEYHGIFGRASFLSDNVYIENFAGDAYHIAGSASAANGANPPRGSVNGWMILGGYVNTCRSGIATSGTDVNAGAAYNTVINSCRYRGVDEQSLLGNKYDNIQFGINGQVDSYGSTPSVVFQTNGYYGCIPGQESGASTNAPAGDGTDNTWWYFIGAAGAAVASKPQWVSGTTYRAGGTAYCKNSGNDSVFTHCYVEISAFPGKLLSDGSSNAMVIGGLLASWVRRAGNQPVAVSGAGKLLKVEPGVSVPGVTSSGATTEVRLGDLADNIRGHSYASVFYGMHSVLASGGYRLKFDEGSGTFALNYANSATTTNFPFQISTPGGTAQFGSGGALSHVFYAPQLALGDIAANITNARRMWMDTAAAASGAHARGEIIWNRNASVGSPIGWMCTVAGTPGTWVAMANL